ncbi:MAG: hypothetical protein JNL98_03585 [Bryobacterales bacterium]|nr:hypothetical protein [Bryobacterales bacterium]
MLLEESEVPMLLLNGLRQLVYANPAFLHSLDAMPGEDPIGMRPGEMWHCMQAEDSPAGCGTSYACRTCHISKTILEAMKWGEFNDWERIRRLHFGSLEIELRVKSMYVLGEMLLLCRLGDEPYHSPIQPADKAAPSDGTVSDGAADGPEPETAPLPETPSVPIPLPCHVVPGVPMVQNEVSGTTAPTLNGYPAPEAPSPESLSQNPLSLTSASATEPAESQDPLNDILENLSTTPEGLVELYLFLASCGEF